MTVGPFERFTARGSFAFLVSENKQPQRPGIGRRGANKREDSPTQKKAVSSPSTAGLLEKQRTQAKRLGGVADLTRAEAPANCNMRFRLPRHISQAKLRNVLLEGRGRSAERVIKATKDAFRTHRMLSD